MVRLLRVLLLLHTAPSILGTGGASAQTLVPGGGRAKSDCYGEWLSPTPTRGTTGVECEDGDPACDFDGAANGACLVAVAVCLHQDNVSACVPSPVRSVSLHAKPKRFGPDLRVPLPSPPVTPVSLATCGNDTMITLPLRTGKKGRPKRSKQVTLRMVTIVGGKPRRDQDKLRLRCVPNTGAGRCSPNPDGGPAELRLVTDGSGTDLDLGWTGNTHGFGVVANATVRVCLGGCGATVNSQCSEREAETTAANDATFGAPLPLLASGIPVCVVNRRGAPALGGFVTDVATGTVAGTMNLVSDFYRTSLAQVCPRCSAATPGQVGLCESGPSQGRACRTAGVVTVRGAEGNATYPVSPTCLPAGVPVGMVTLAAPLTSGTSTLAGPRPCGAARDDGCGGGTCSAPCTGRACVVMVNDRCQDVKGGVNQLCCSTNSEQACFPTGSGVPIVRTGTTTAPVPAFGDPTYPKHGGVTLVGTFCAPASGSSIVDTIAGLPGPGAVELPLSAAWLP